MTTLFLALKMALHIGTLQSTKFSPFCRRTLFLAVKKALSKALFFGKSTFFSSKKSTFFRTFGSSAPYSMHDNLWFLQMEVSALIQVQQSVQHSHQRQGTFRSDFDWLTLRWHWGDIEVTLRWHWGDIAVTLRWHWGDI